MFALYISLVNLSYVLITNLCGMRRLRITNFTAHQMKGKTISQYKCLSKLSFKGGMRCIRQNRDVKNYLATQIGEKL